jgi:transposase
MSMRPAPLPDPDPVVAAAIRRKYAGRKAPLAVAMRDRLGPWLADEVFASAFARRGRPGLSPAMLAIVTVLQYAEGLTDREAAEAARARLDWQYALGLPLDDAGFDHSVLSEFRDRVAAHGLELAVLDALLARLAADGLVAPGGRQRTDSTHILARARDLHTHELVRRASGRRWRRWPRRARTGRRPGCAPVTGMPAMAPGPGHGLFRARAGASATTRPRSRTPATATPWCRPATRTARRRRPGTCPPSRCCGRSWCSGS